MPTCSYDQHLARAQRLDLPPALRGEVHKDRTPTSWDRVPSAPRPPSLASTCQHLKD